MDAAKYKNIEGQFRPRQKTKKMKKSYYAEQTPRGFANETNTYRFTTKAERDAWVEEHENDGDMNSSDCGGARAITARQARANVGCRGDAVTTSYNNGFIDM